MPRADRVLPSLRHFAVTWGLPDQFGGMTRAMLRRSAGFAAAGAGVTVLTFDDRLDTARYVEALRADGALEPGVDVLHLWDWLAEHQLAPNPNVDDLPFSPLSALSARSAAGDAVVEIVSDGMVRRRERRAPDGTVLQVDRYRPDGSLLASDLRDAGTRGSLGGRAIVVCDDRGAPLRGWRTAGALYRHWLDRLTDRQPSIAIVDSKTAARFMRKYRRKHVAVVHVIHGAHRAGDGEVGRAFSASRHDALHAAEDFDAIVTLTERQRADLLADLPASARVAVVPNGHPLGHEREAPGRSTQTGVVVASLTRRKRVGQAMTAAAAAGVPLDVYGDGPERGALQRRLSTLGPDARVRLRGHSPDAAAAFRNASFSLLTSSSEGAPLVLVESMAAGCIPIAYDIRYGPRDIIRDGVDGFLVAPGDTEAMAARIREVVGMPERRLGRMRRAARRSAERFDQARVTEEWAALIADIARRRWHVPMRTRVRARVGAGVRRFRARLVAP